MEHNGALMEHLELMAKRGIKSTTMHLEPLDIQQTTKLISETLQMEEDEKSLTKLSKVIFEKTKGNPFFVGSFLSALYNKHLLVCIHYIKCLFLVF